MSESPEKNDEVQDPDPDPDTVEHWREQAQAKDAIIKAQDADIARLTKERDIYKEELGNAPSPDKVAEIERALQTALGEIKWHKEQYVQLEGTYAKAQALVERLQGKILEFHEQAANGPEGSKITAGDVDTGLKNDTQAPEINVGSILGNQAGKVSPAK